MSKLMFHNVGTAGSLLLGIFILLTTLPASAQVPLGTSFTLQGLLENQGQIVNGPVDFIFEAYDDPDPEVGTFLATSSQDDVNVIQGLFTVEIDLTASVFTGSEVWIKTSVKSPGESMFTDLFPLQRVSAAPYALHALTATTAAEAEFAQDADLLDGLDASEFLLTTGGTVTGSLNITGDVEASTFTLSGTTISNWLDIPGGMPDNLGNHIAEKNLHLGGHWLSSDGDNEGLSITDTGKVTMSTNGSMMSINGTNRDEPVLKIKNGYIDFDTTFGMRSFEGAQIKTGPLGKTFQFWPGDDQSHSVIFRDHDNVQQVVVDKDGYLGVGVFDPQVRLDVLGNASINGNVGINGSLTAGSINTPRIRSNGGARIESGQLGGTFQFWPGSSQSHSVIFRDFNNVQQVVVDKDGDLGVGVFNPQVRLDVNGNARISGNLTAGTINTSNINADIISVGGHCFKPRTLVRCLLPTLGDHLAWVNNRTECLSAGGTPENELTILGSC